MTRVSAAAASFGARLHLRIVRPDALAVLGAMLTYVRTQATGSGMELRATQHEISARLADLHAILQQTNVRNFGMFPAHLQAVSGRFDADVVAVLTITNALLHPRGHMRGVTLHLVASFYSAWLDSSSAEQALCR